MSRISGIIYGLVLLSLSLTVSSQTLSDLNSEKDAILSLIDESNKLLTDYSEKKSSEMMQISLIDDKISKRKRLINIYNNQIFAYTSQIKTLSMQLDSLENELFKLKEDYSRMIYQQSINKMDDNALLYILSAKSFNESYRRFLFMRQYNDYRRQQAEMISDKKKFFNELKDKVTAKRAQVDKLVSEAKRESTTLEYELSDRQSKVDQFSKQQNNLIAQIAEAEKKKKIVDEQIVALIKEEARKARESGNAKMLSSDITKNKGLLPWPCDKYVIVSTYGEHEHPLVPNIMVRNNGVDIDVLDSKKIHPIHAGKVSKVIMNTW